jgi:phenylacetate-coenzyme A ligase PaaK-like adenylate-forming protein
MSEALIFHYENSERFREFCIKKIFKPHEKFSLNEIPFIPSSIFKKLELSSVPKDSIIKTVHSSSTTGNTPSTILIDKITSERQQKIIISILSDFIGKDRKSFLILEAKDNVDTGNEMSSRSSAVRGLTPFMKSINFLLKTDLSLDFEKIQDINFENSTNYVFFGFTWILYLLIEKYQNDQNVKKLFSKLNKPIILHSGGWKKLQNIKISKTEFNEKVSSFFQTDSNKVIDFYGMVEQLGTIYPDCEYGFKHVPLYSHIIIRDINTLEEVEPGNRGFIQIITPIPHSYPGVSVLTDDIGKVIGINCCKCGRKGICFKFLERLKTADLAGCGDTFEM